MSYQALRRAPISPVTIDELIADPGRAKSLEFETVPELLAEIASREAALKTLQGALLSLMLIKHGGSSRSAEAGLLDAPELAKRLGVPESWVREQARLGRLPFIRLGHYVRFRLEEVERFLAEQRSQAA